MTDHPLDEGLAMAVRVSDALFALHCADHDGWCWECGKPYPCMTVRAVADAMTGSVTT